MPFVFCMFLVAIALFLFLQRTSIEKKGIVWLLCLYLLSLYYFSTFTRDTLSGSLWRLQPLWSYFAAILAKDWYLLVQNVLNILLFIPIGFLFHTHNQSKKKSFVYGFFFIVLLETSQIVFQKGYFDLDDFLHNGLGVFLGISLSQWLSKKNQKLRYVCSHYDVKKGEDALRIAVMSDLHEFPSMGFLEELTNYKPDLILLVGDVLERREGHKHQKKEEYKGNWMLYRFAWFLDDMLEFFFGKQDRKSEYSQQFLVEAKKIAPVIYSRGNHEKKMFDEDYVFFKENDILFLDNEDIEMTIRSRKILIGGLSSEVDEIWLDGFAHKEGEKILMMHHPEYFEQYLSNYSFDLILSGHAHGGQVRIGKQGLFSPGQGLFPKYTKGLYPENFIVSSGCSNTSYIPRIGNPREIVEIEF